MNLLDALNRELDRHRTASDPASARAEIVRMFSEFIDDSARIDWLADVDQNIGCVMLPPSCVENNITSLRDAIDAARKDHCAAACKGPTR